jgi:hypothetical protein
MIDNEDFPTWGDEVQKGVSGVSYHHRPRVVCLRGHESTLEAGTIALDRRVWYSKRPQPALQC